MKIFHTQLVSRWNKLPLFEQMANIGAEVGRAINWRKKNDPKMSTNAFYRALELTDFTIDDPKNKKSLKEILRMRELLVDYFAGDNIYHSSDGGWEKYFYPFNFAARHRFQQTKFTLR
jgi:hypothetical protein